jgi:hypothetical protein
MLVPLARGSKVLFSVLVVVALRATTTKNKLKKSTILPKAKHANNVSSIK